MISITQRKEEKIISEEMEPPGNRVKFYYLAIAGETEKNLSSEMILHKTTF
jgi:hypothetical protein